MKNLTLLLFFFVASINLVNAQTTQLSNFEELMQALNSGEEVRAVFHYKNCQLISDNKIADPNRVPDAIGGMGIDVYEYFAAGAIRNKEAFVVFSVSKLIENPIGEGYVYNYAKVKVYENNEVQIIARYIDSKTMEEVMDESFYTQVNDGKDDKKAAFFYKN